MAAMMKPRRSRERWVTCKWNFRRNVRYGLGCSGIAARFAFVVYDLIGLPDLEGHKIPNPHRASAQPHTLMLQRI
jgi:hypothetical protein